MTLLVSALVTVQLLVNQISILGDRVPSLPFFLLDTYINIISLEVLSMSMVEEGKEQISCPSSDEETGGSSETMAS